MVNRGAMFIEDGSLLFKTTLRMRLGMKYFIGEMLLVQCHNLPDGIINCERSNGLVGEVFFSK